jgi:hypothetical protein
MSDFYLKFADEVQAKSVLYRIEGAIEADSETGTEAKAGYEVGNYANIDVIGVMYELQAITDTENLSEPIALDGWHVNVRVVAGEDDTPLLPYSVIPTQPRRVWG